jgi:hypothetical protein
MLVTQETYDKFFQITNYDLGQFVFRAKDFFGTSLPIISNFYSGNARYLDKKHLKELNLLTDESVKILAIFKSYSLMLNTCDFWMLLDGIEDIRTHLQYVQNLPKYLRSSYIKGKVKAGYNYQYTMSANETLEDIAMAELGAIDFDRKAQEIAIDNDLREVDWDIDGGTQIQLTDNSFQMALVTSMIDYTIGDRIYGKDIDRLLKFQNDDLKVLSYKETAYQTVDILCQLKKKDIPEYPWLGTNGNYWTGSNLAMTNLPIIGKELENIFRTDDLFKNFKMRRVEYREGDVFIEFEVSTKRDLVIVNNVTI